MRSLFWALLWLLAFPAGAADKLRPIPPLTGPVIDLTGTLSAGQQRALAHKLQAFQQQHGPQIQILMISSSAPEDAFSYSMRVVEEWKLGTKEKDDGLLIFVAKKDRRSQMQVGYGLEGTIPDAIASRLLNDVMAPHFKQGDFYGGLNAVVDGVFARITGDFSSMPPTVSSRESNKSNSGDDWIPPFVIGAVILLQILKSTLGRLTTALAGGPLMVLIGWLIGMPLFVALFMTALILIGVLSSSRRGRYSRGGFGGGGFGVGRSGGGGGGFGGGGAGGRW